GNNTELHCFLNTLINRGDVFTRNTATGDLVLKLVELLTLRVQRFEGHDDLRELPRTTSLLLVSEVHVNDWTANRLAVSDLWLTNVGVNLEFATHPVNKNIQVKFTHTADNCVTGFFVLMDGERGVFFSQFLDRCRQLFLV